VERRVRLSSRPRSRRPAPTCQQVVDEHPAPGSEPFSTARRGCHRRAGPSVARRVERMALAPTWTARGRRFHDFTDERDDQGCRRRVPTGSGTQRPASIWSETMTATSGRRSIARVGSDQGGDADEARARSESGERRDACSRERDTGRGRRHGYVRCARPMVWVMPRSYSRGRGASATAGQRRFGLESALR